MLEASSRYTANAKRLMVEALGRSNADRHSQGAAGPTFRELWVPAEELAEFNEAIVGRIEIVSEYRPM